MKHPQHFILTMIMAFIACQAMAQTGSEENQPMVKYTKKKTNSGFGLVFKGSTTGVGADLVYRFNDKLDFRLGFDTAKFSINDQISNDDFDLEINANLESGTLSALLNYYLGKRFFLTAGVMSNNFSTYAEGKLTDDYLWGDVTISKEDFGSIDFTVEPGSKIAPYFGIGFGRALSIKRRISMALEFGALYFGQPDFTINATGALSPTSDPINAQEEILESEFEEFVFYPVIKFSLGIKLSKK